MIKMEICVHNWCSPIDNFEIFNHFESVKKEKLSDTIKGEFIKNTFYYVNYGCFIKSRKVIYLFVKQARKLCRK